MAPIRSSTLTLGTIYGSGGGVRAAMAVSAAVLSIGALLSVRWGNPEEETVGPTARKEASHA